MTNAVPRDSITRRDFGRFAVVSAAAVPLAGISSLEAAPETSTPPQKQAAANEDSKPDLKPHPSLTPGQAAKLDEALGRLAGQLGEIRKHRLAYSAEPAFTFRAEIPRRVAPAIPKG
jgi:hypothetical protein